MSTPQPMTRWVYAPWKPSSKGYLVTRVFDGEDRIVGESMRLSRSKAVAL